MDEMLWKLYGPCQALIGLALIIWSTKLSLRYNAWTTQLRQRKSCLSPPPAPQMRELNTRIMTWILRILGAFILLAALPILFAFVRLT